MKTRPSSIATVTVLAAVLALTAVAATAQDATPPPDPVVLDGADRYETAAMIALSVYPANQSTETLYIANGDTMVDALVMGGNIDASTERRLLLVQQDNIPPATRDALETISHAKLVFLGGDDAISPDIRDEVASLTCNYVHQPC